MKYKGRRESSVFALMAKDITDHFNFYNLNNLQLKI